MSHAITALLLLQLDRVPGEWVAVDQMAHHLSLARPVVCDHLQPLAIAGQVWLQRADNGLILAAKSPAGDCDAEPGRSPDPGSAHKTAQEPVSGLQATTPLPQVLGRIGSGSRPESRPAHALIQPLAPKEPA